jgi:gamma-glutamylcyclotransferase (GGCT)/AIG2-like uncharacterized protein YtfP
MAARVSRSVRPGQRRCPRAAASWPANSGKMGRRADVGLLGGQQPRDNRAEQQQRDGYPAAANCRDLDQPPAEPNCGWPRRSLASRVQMTWMGAGPTPLGGASYLSKSHAAGVTNRRTCWARGLTNRSRRASIECMTDERPTSADRDQLDAFFVYGTLRPGQWNSRLIAPLVVETMPATLHDHVLYGQRLPFPYAVPGPGRVVGDVLRFDLGSMPEAVRILDALEGYRGEGKPNHYVRRPVSVVTGRGSRRAWVYLAGISVSRLAPSQVIRTGDWCDIAGGERR